MIGPFEDFVDAVVKKSRQGIFKGDNCCPCFITSPESQTDRNYCFVCKHLREYKLSSANTISIRPDSIFEIMGKQYRIDICQSLEDAVNRKLLSRDSSFFMNVLFAFSCGDKYFVLYSEQSRDVSMRQMSFDILKFCEKAPPLQFSNLEWSHIRRSGKTFKIDPKPFSLFYDSTLSRNYVGNGSFFTALIFAYGEMKPENIREVVGYHYNGIDINTITTRIGSGNYKYLEGEIGEPHL